MLGTILYGLIGLVVAVVAGRLLRGRQASLPLPPGPPALPLIGNVHQAPVSHPWLQYHEWSKTYGPVMHLNMLGQSVIVLSSVKAASDLLSKRGATYSDRPRLVVANEMALKGMHILLRPYDERYKLHQRMETPILNPSASASYRVLQDIESKQLLFDLLSDRGSESTGVNPHPHFQRVTASFIFLLTFGFRLKTASEPEMLRANEIQNEFSVIAQPGRYMVDVFPVLNKLPLPGFLTPWKRDAERHFRAQRDLHVGHLERGLGAPGWNFSKQLKASPEAAGMPFEEVAFNLGIMADAALDTTTVQMDWFVVACLTQRGQRFVTKAQSMMDEVVGRHRLPVHEDRPALPYIDAIVEELLRWRPIGPAGVPHRNMKEDSYEGFAIPKGSVVIASHWGITRDVTVFGEDPDQFIPERWIPESPSGAGDENRMKAEVMGPLKDLPTIGFGYGRRVCPGRHIARNSMWVQIARLLWAFDIEPGHGAAGGALPLADPTACTSGIVSSPLPFQARFRPRGPWVTRIISEQCFTQDMDLTGLLDTIGGDKALKR